MHNKEKAKNYNALYRKQHYIAIAIKNRMYKNLPHIKERRHQQNRLRKDYFKRYYQEHKEYFRQKSAQWVKEHPLQRRLILKRYSEKQRQKRKHARSRIERIIAEFLQYCKDRYDNDTLRHYTMNMTRFYNYIKQHNTHCKEYHTRYYLEKKKPASTQDFSWMKDYRRIQYAEELDRDFIARYVSFVNYDEISKNAGLPLNQSEKESRLYPLKTFLRYCQRKGYLKDDLCKFIHVPPREKKILKRALTQDEMKQLIESPDTNTIIGIRDRALLELSYSALRSEEMLSLKIEQIDLIANSITILNGKGDKDRVVPMTTEAIYWLKQWLSRRCEFIANHPDQGYIFITKRARPLTRRHLSKLIKRYARKSHIGLDISPHDLRRATATHLAENGAPLRLIQALLGHATLKVTTKYIRLSDEKIKQEYLLTHPSNRRQLHYANIPR